MSVTASPVLFLLVLALVVERDFFEKGLQAGRTAAGGAPDAVQRGNQSLQVADAVLGGLRILFGAAQFGEVADLVEEMVGPGLQT